MPHSSLGYTQSAISQQIAALERIVGQRLIDRPGGPRPVTLTDAGTLLLTHAARHHRAPRCRAGRPRCLRQRRLRPAAASARISRVGARVLPTLLAAFPRRVAPGRRSAVESADDRELLELVERGDIDLSFCVFPLEGGPFESVELMRDPYVLVVANDSPLAEREKPPTLREILDLPLISYRTCRTTHRVEERLRLAGREPEVVFRSDDNGTVQALVASGVGVALVPRLTVDPLDDSIAVIELGDRVPPRIIGVAWHADRQLTPAAQMFIQAAEEVCRSKELAAA